MAVGGHIDPDPWISLLLPLELLSAPAGSRFVHCALDVDNLTVYLVITTPSAACPPCGSDARRVHSRYDRRLADLPGFGRAVRLQVTVGRFSCPRPECPRRIFAERLPGLAEPRSRTTVRLCRAHESIGYTLGGVAGARLTARLSMTTSSDTLLRRVKQEGHVNRLKTIERQMYGRAGFVLLRAQVVSVA